MRVHGDGMVRAPAAIGEYAGIRPGTGWLLAGSAGLLFLGLFLVLGGGSLSRGALEWYGLTNGINASLVGPIGGIAAQAGIPLLAAALFGLLGATSPCQLSTNAAALAYVVQGGTQPARVGQATLGYVLGKGVTYGLLGAAALLLGQQVASSTVPTITVVRKALGPLMVLLALVLLGLLRPNIGIGYGLSAWLEERAPHSPLPGGFVLGLAFGLAFCPTLFLLFFTLTIPLALASSYGILFPLLFALGTTVPLVALASLAALSATAGGGALRSFSTADRVVRPAAAVVFLLAGLNDTFVYWFL